MLNYVIRARDVKGLVLFAACLFWRQKNRSEAEPGAARPGAQKKSKLILKIDLKNLKT